MSRVTWAHIVIKLSRSQLKRASRIADSCISCLNMACDGCLGRFLALVFIIWVPDLVIVLVLNVVLVTGKEDYEELKDDNWSSGYTMLAIDVLDSIPLVCLYHPSLCGICFHDVCSHPHFPFPKVTASCVIWKVMNESNIRRKSFQGWTLQYIK